MNFSIKKIFITSAVFLASHLHSLAQATHTYLDPDATFKQAKEYYQNEQYSLAYPLFKELLNNIPGNSQLPLSTQLESKYYTIVCGLKLNETASEEQAKEFIATEYNAPRVEMLCFHLGEYYFRNQHFDEAMAYYEKAGIDNLSNRDIAEMKFHQAYSYFTLKQFDKARPLFNVIRQIPLDPNFFEANYYFGFISFFEKDYKLALEAFRRVENQPAYQKIVPYYIAEILYFSGEKDNAIKYAEGKLKAGDQYYDVQLRQLVGHSYFEKKNYVSALPYLEEYAAKTDKVRREDLYEISYTYYETKLLDKAIIGFKQLGGKEDSLAQNSMYLLADAYLKTGQKANARSAFLFCAANSSNLVQKEISEFNYAKLSFDLGYQDIALSELQKFIKSYPNSSQIAEAKELLVNVLANTNNYKEALTLYQSLQGKSETVRKVYPKIAYGRAVEYVNEQQLGIADSMLTELLSVPYNTAQLPYIYFWKGELAYRKNNDDQAIEFLEKYLKNPQSMGEANATNANYTLGHVWLHKENYKQALTYFEQVARKATPSLAPTEQDAFVRSADAHFMNRNYKQAQDMYEQVYANNLAAADYALYQKALIAGAANRTADKVNLLQSLEQKFPKSALIADANLEIANTYLANEDYRAALPALNKILKIGTATALYPQVYLKTGIANFNLENNDAALTNFKTLISKYPNSQESEASIEYVRNIFIEQQKPGEFVTFMKQNGKEISYSEEDSLNFASANIRYSNNDIPNALTGFKNYLNKFDDGRYAIEANYNIAEIYNSLKEYANSLIGYTYVASKAPNKFAEKCVLQAARINFFEIKNYEEAEKYFGQLKGIATLPGNKLEGMRGLLRCQFKLNKWTDAVSNAQDLLTQKSIATDDKMMANMVIAKSLQISNDYEGALSGYKIVMGLGKSEFAAEARYQSALITFLQNKLPDAEKAAFEVINKAGSYEYWTTKAYILLGDIYWKQKDYFNAEATLKSVSENTTIPELKQEARTKLNDVIAEKEASSKVMQ